MELPHNADPGAAGARLWRAGSEFPQIPSRGEGCLARRASWGHELPGWLLAAPRANFDQRAE
eukprot:15461958-Alexandrium_andersonii.AAC.1